MSKTVLITGAGGQVGHELAIAPSAHRLIALDRQQLDITEPQQIKAAFAEYRPDIVINTAAYTQVDKAEGEAERAFAINRDGVEHLGFACRQMHIPLLHVSTEFVFDGSKSVAYTESDPIAPLGIYGASKAEGEAALRTTCEQHIILRTNWVFSVTGNNFVKTMLRLGKERDELNVVNDQHVCPTSARSIAQVLMQTVDRYLQTGDIEWGSYHYCNKPATTWFKFARARVQQGQEFENLILNAIGTADFPTTARRPLNSSLNCSKLKSNFEIEQHEWSRELKLVLNQLSD